MRTLKTSILILVGLIFISCDKQPVADFTWEPLEPKAGEQVKFTNLSTDAIGYSWNFGDMSIGSEENPTHVYENSGSYIIDLTAHGILLSDQKTVTININN